MKLSPRPARGLGYVPLVVDRDESSVGERSPATERMALGRSRVAPPWHLWGHELPIQPTAPAAGTFVAQSQQLVRVDYGRPETWFFIFSVIFSAQDTTNVTSIDVFFDINLGTGRSVMVIQGFEHYTFVPADVGTQKYSTQVTGPKRFAAEVAVNPVQTISAESINVVARASLVAAGPCSPIVLCSAMFTPSTHVRPEWYEGEFPGGEDKGK